MSGRGRWNLKDSMRGSYLGPVSTTTTLSVSSGDWRPYESWKSENCSASVSGEPLGESDRVVSGPMGVWAASTGGRSILGDPRSPKCSP